MKILVVILVLIGSFLLWPREKMIRYIALGDSYTIGEGVTRSESWPELLVADLKSRGMKINLVANLAGTGKATTEVLSEQLPELGRQKPDIVSLLIGANDVNRGYDEGAFTKNLRLILDQLPPKTILLTIPDFSVTPKGKTFGDPTKNSAKIVTFNNIIKTEAAVRNLPVVDVFSLSQEIANDRSLVANDGLHPSGKEYLLWEKIIFPVVYDILKNSEKVFGHR